MRHQAARVGLDPVLTRSRAGRAAPPTDAERRRRSPRPVATASGGTRGAGLREPRRLQPGGRGHARPGAPCRPMPNAACSPPARSSEMPTAVRSPLRLETEQAGRGHGRAGDSAHRRGVPAAFVERRVACARKRRGRLEAGRIRVERRRRATGRARRRAAAPPAPPARSRARARARRCRRSRARGRRSRPPSRARARPSPAARAAGRPARADPRAAQASQSRNASAIAIRVGHRASIGAAVRPRVRRPRPAAAGARQAAVEAPRAGPGAPRRAPAERNARRQGALDPQDGPHAVRVQGIAVAHRGRRRPARPHRARIPGRRVTSRRRSGGWGGGGACCRPSPSELVDNEEASTALTINYSFVDPVYRESATVAARAAFLLP